MFWLVFFCLVSVYRKGNHYWWVDVDTNDVLCLVYLMHVVGGHAATFSTLLIRALSDNRIKNRFLSPLLLFLIFKKTQRKLYTQNKLNTN